MNDAQPSRSDELSRRARRRVVRLWREREQGMAPRTHAACEHCAHCKRQEKVSADRRHLATPPDIRGRRGQPLIPEIPGLAEWMEEQFKEEPRPSFRQIETRLKETTFWNKIRAAGFRTGKSSIHTHWVRWNAESARKRVVADAAATYNASGSAADVLDIEAAISGLANVAIFEELQQELSDGKGVTAKAGALIDLHRKLQTSSARREAERRQSGVSTRRAYESARAEIVTILESHPDVLQLVLAAIDKAQKEAA
ncbi:MAG TPA: hypothetical protein VFN10_22565 [Thermoanaerobaculia bacterium]|nr:hypothetical protein [Thermoanaerobaculia bacterium]